MEKVLLLGGTGLVGKAIYQVLQNKYRVVITSGHHEVKGGWRLRAEEPETLRSILNKEDPDIIISSIHGEFQAQLQFHEMLADWIAGKNKRLLFISTGNVYDGDCSRTWTEEDIPIPESDYGIYKRDCEMMLQKKIPNQLIIFRLSFVWASECPRVQVLKECSYTKKSAHTYQGIMVNISLAEQIGCYAKYVLDHNLTGIFHVGTKDVVDYFEFDRQICEIFGIQPSFEIEQMKRNSYQAVIPAREEIPEEFQLTVEQVLKLLKRAQISNYRGDSNEK